MEDFFEAGGLPVVIRELASRGLLHENALTVNGRTIGENNRDAQCWKPDVVRSFDAPFKHDSGIAVLRGNLAPDGAIVKPSAASPHLLRHTGRAVVFESIEDLHERINDDALAIDENSVMVLKYCGPKGYPGMAEVGNMPLPPKLLKRGITDVVRISDARMSGTAYGTVVLHTAPESAAGGPLALVRNGDRIRLSVRERKIDLQVSEAELAKRKAAWRRPAPVPNRGYGKLYMEHVLQAEHGCDFDFLRRAP
jgi:dihydroxy-acid dehydratase